MMKTVVLIIIFFSATFSALSARDNTPQELRSPDGSIVVNITTYPALQYSVAMDGETILDPSPLSLDIGAGTVIGVGQDVVGMHTESVDNTFSSPFYKKQEVRDNYHRLSIDYKEGWSVEFRAYDDGMAYRFVWGGRRPIRIFSEQAVYNFPDDLTASVPYVRIEDGIRKSVEQQLENSFENVYDRTKLSALDSNRLIFTPMAVEFPTGKKAVIIEADLEDYPGMFMRNPDGNRSLCGVFAKYPSRWEIGGHNMLQQLVTAREKYIASVDGPRTFPWRALVLSRNDTDLIDNDMVYKLASPCRIDDLSWIVPGKVAWEWWNNWGIYDVDFKVGINTPTYKHYIDFAEQNGIRYVIMDEGWSERGSGDMFRVVPQIDIREIVGYGAERGVGIILWGGYLPFDRDMEELCRHYSAMGIKGFKIDFVDRDDQLAVDFVYRAAETAARHKLLLDFHGIYKPTGLNRTYPNVLTVEGVHGLETSKWTPVEKADQAIYDVTVPYLRMLAGPMDYTQGAMDNCTRETFRPVFDEPMSLGTRCRQLAQYIVYLSPLSMLCDSPVNYRQQEECLKFIASLPTVWDRTVPLAGEMGKYIVVARYHDQVWYVGGLTDWDARTCTIDMGMLEQGDYTVELFCDGVNADRSPRDYKVRRFDLEAAKTFTVDMAPGGGFAAIIRRK